MILKKCHLLLIAKKLQYLFSKINSLRKCIVFHFLFGVTPRGLWPTSGLEFQAKSSVPNIKTFGLDPIICSVLEKILIGNFPSIKVAKEVFSGTNFCSLKLYV